MRELARAGFGDSVPILQGHAPDQRRKVFIEFADSYRTKWRLCPSCAALAKKYLPVDAAEPAVAQQIDRSGAVQKYPLRVGVSNLGSMARRSIAAVARSELALAVFIFLIIAAGVGIWNAAPERYTALRQWWQTRDIIALAEERAKSNDWVGVRAILRRAMIEDPENPRLLQRAANVELILGRPDIAAFHLQALAFNPAAELLQRQRAHATANQIAASLRAGAKQIVEEVYRINEMLPRHMRGTAPFHPLEAISSPPAVEPLYIGLIHKPESLDPMQAICFGLSGSCNWSFDRMAWKDILIGRQIRIKHPYPPAGSLCCELMLDDPDLADPASALQRIGKMEVVLRLREMFRLASKLSFVANMIAFNERRPPDFR